MVKSKQVFSGVFRAKMFDTKQNTDPIVVFLFQASPERAWICIPSNPGSPKLRMVSWNQKKLCVLEVMETTYAK